MHGAVYIGVISNWKSGTLNTEAGLPLGGLGSRLGWKILGKIKNLLYQARLFMKNQNNVRRSCRPLTLVGMPPPHTAAFCCYREEA